MAAKNSPKATANEFTVSYAVSRILSALPAARKAKAEKTHPTLCGFVAAFDAELCLPRFRAMPDLIAFREYLERLGAESDPDVEPLAAEAESAEQAVSEPAPVETPEGLPEIPPPGPVVEVETTPPVENTPEPARVDPPAPAPEPTPEPGDLSDEERDAMAAAMGDDDGPEYSLAGRDDIDAEREMETGVRAAAPRAGKAVADDDTFSLSEDESAAAAVAVAEPAQDVVTFKVTSPGVTYPGRCVKCGSNTGRSDYHRAQTLLIRRPNGKYAVAHPECAGGRVKNRVNGGSRYDGPTEFRCVDAS